MDIRNPPTSQTPTVFSIMSVFANSITRTKRVMEMKQSKNASYCKPQLRNLPKYMTLIEIFGSENPFIQK